MSAKAEDWLRFASEDFQAARTLADADHAYPRQTGFHAQQAAEKALKAVFVAGDRLFPFSHDLVLLYDLLPEPLRARLDVNDLGLLSVFAIRTRYPDNLPDVTADDALNALRIATDVLEAVEAHLARR